MSLKHGLPAGTNSVEDGVCHGFADFKVILTKCKNYLCQLLNVHGVKNVRLTDIYIYIYIYIYRCATNRKVAGSIPDGFIGIFH